MVAEHYIEDDFVILLGDTIVIDGKDLQSMINAHQKCNASATILVEYVKDPERYGVVKFDMNNPGRIISLYEKPKEQKIKDEFKTNDGWYVVAWLYIFDRNIFDFLKITNKDINNEIQLTDAIRLSLKNGNIVLGHVLNGKRIDVGGLDYLQEERNFYVNMSNHELNNIIKGRHDKMKYMI